MSTLTKLEAERPVARAKNLLIEEIGGELLVYDTIKNRAHCLNESAAAVWKHCDGSRTVSELARQVFPQMSPASGEQVVNLALERLRRRNLLNGDLKQPIVDLSRRQLLRQVGMAAAGLGILAPLVSTVVAPNSAYALSCFPHGMPCSSPTQCCSGLCNVFCA